MRAAALVLLANAAAATAAARAGADVARGDQGPRGWYAGLDLRSDYGTHLVRTSLGARFRCFAATLVLDPKVFFDPKQNDIDALFEWVVRPGTAAVFGGTRLTQLSIDRGSQFHHMALVGVSGSLPALLDRRVRSSFGIELEMTVVRHGAGIETSWIGFGEERDYRDLFSLNLLLRLEYAAPW